MHCFYIFFIHFGGFFEYFDIQPSQCFFCVFQCFRFYSKLRRYTQVLFIPSSCDKIAVDSKDYFDFYLQCYEGHDIANSVFWTIGGNREELRNFDTLDDALATFYWTADWSETGYQVMSSYDWYSFDNQVDDDKYCEYYDVN